ncbi:MAG: CoA ester lyase [Acetobacteraceae bacterium]|nr:CoA ester lyase [Acetobacteraceae bacterium]
MIETAKGVLNVSLIAALGEDASIGLRCLVAGTNDLMKATGVRPTPDRRYLVSWLMQIIIAGRAGGLDVIDGVCDDFRNIEAFERECDEARLMGFDGKSLIHPRQIEPANRAFSPSQSEIAEAREIVRAYAQPENQGRGAISIGGRMVERLHLVQAQRLLARHHLLGLAGV